MKREFPDVMIREVNLSKFTELGTECILYVINLTILML